MKTKDFNSSDTKMGPVPALLISIACSPPGQQSKLLIKIRVESRRLLDCEYNLWKL